MDNKLSLNLHLKHLAGIKNPLGVVVSEITKQTDDQLGFVKTRGFYK